MKILNPSVVVIAICAAACAATSTPLKDIVLRAFSTHDLPPPICKKYTTDGRDFFTAEAMVSILSPGLPLATWHDVAKYNTASVVFPHQSEHILANVKEEVDSEEECWKFLATLPLPLVPDEQLDMNHCHKVEFPVTFAGLRIDDGWFLCHQAIIFSTEANKIDPVLANGSIFYGSNVISAAYMALVDANAVDMSEPMQLNTGIPNPRVHCYFNGAITFLRPLRQYFKYMPVKIQQSIFTLYNNPSVENANQVMTLLRADTRIYNIDPLGVAGCSRSLASDIYETFLERMNPNKRDLKIDFNLKRNCNHPSFKHFITSAKFPDDRSLSAALENIFSVKDKICNILIDITGNERCSVEASYSYVPGKYLYLRVRNPGQFFTVDGLTYQTSGLDGYNLNVISILSGVGHSTSVVLEDSNLWCSYDDAKKVCSESPFTFGLKKVVGVLFSIKKSEI